MHKADHTNPIYISLRTAKADPSLQYYSTRRCNLTKPNLDLKRPIPKDNPKMTVQAN